MNEPNLFESVGNYSTLTHDAGEVAPANNSHLTQDREFIEAAQAMPTDCVIGLVRQRLGVVLTAANGQQRNVGPEFLLQHVFSVSRRTAYRHLKDGTIPSLERRVGSDGKLYPAGKGRRRDKLETELRLCWQALNRADKEGQVHGYTTAHKQLLRQISDGSQRMLAELAGTDSTSQTLTRVD